ncbi:MAG: class I SAM-dependent DNA methyltransferase [Christensenellaceae bacterium]|jgi:SAM-dependent methyltransferase
MNQYEYLAAAYDELMYDVMYEDWAGYIAGLLGEEVRTVLEYACGTGNITGCLLERGYEVTATDISADMLDIAQKKLDRAHHGKVRFAQADMADFSLNKPADAAVCCCDGVNYILEEQRLRSFFENACANIRRGGRFLFDISSAYKLENILGNEFFYDDSDEATCLWQSAFDADASLLTMDVTLFRANGACYKRYDERHTQRAWARRQIEDALERAGFEDIHAFAFMTKDMPDNKTERIQFLAVKG